jgi:hypothetical protein
MWKQRGRIPADWLARVIYALVNERANLLTFYTDSSEFE